MSQLLAGTILSTIVALLALGAGWAGWVSVTLIKILQGITANDTRLDDVERRLLNGGL